MAAIEGIDHIVEVVPRNIHSVGAVFGNRFSPSRALMRQQSLFRLRNPWFEPGGAGYGAQRCEDSDDIEDDNA